MKKFLALTALVAVSATPSFAQTLANWTFEANGLGATSYSPGANTTTTNFLAEGGLQAGTASITGLHVGSSAYTSPAGNGSARSLSSTLWAPGDYYQIQLTTTGFHGLSLSWDQTSSATGPKDFTLSYSLNGTSFTTFNSYSPQVNGAPNVGWNASTSSSVYTTTDDLGSLIDDSSTVFLRFTVADTTSENGGVIATGGTDRIDNVSVFTTPVPEPSAVAFGIAGGLAGLAFWIRRK